MSGAGIHQRLARIFSRFVMLRSPPAGPKHPRESSAHEHRRKRFDRNASRRPLSPAAASGSFAVLRMTPLRIAFLCVSVSLWWVFLAAFEGAVRRWVHYFFRSGKMLL